MKSWCALLSFTLLLTACGKGTVTINTPAARKNVNQLVSSPQSLYESLPGPELHVQVDPANGLTQTQKQTNGSFCRKIAGEAPNPVYRFECWKSDLTNDQSHAQYDFIRTTSYHVNVGNTVGPGTEEKVSSERDLLCQKVTDSYPGAGSSYSCFRSL